MNILIRSQRVLQNLNSLSSVNDLRRCSSYFTAAPKALGIGAASFASEAIAERAKI